MPFEIGHVFEEKGLNGMVWQYKILDSKKVKVVVAEEEIEVEHFTVSFGNDFNTELGTFTEEQLKIRFPNN